MTKAKTTADLPLDGYVRVSAVGERGGDDSYGSPTVQREAEERWATYKGERLAAVHVDEDQSGGTQDRPGLNAAIERALTGQTGGIVAYNISRFSRFTEGGLADLRRLREAGARLVFVQEDVDTSTWQGRMVYTILLAIHEAALEQLKAGWKVTKARAIREGRQIGPTPPGYRRTTERNGRPKGSLVPDGARGEAITDAYNAVARDEDVRAAIPILEQAIPKKTFVARKRQTAERYGVELGESVTVDATWNPATVRRVLASRVYLGEAFYRYKLHREGCKGRGNCDCPYGDEAELRYDAHPKLIDGVTWRRVQKIIGIPEHQRRAPAEKFPLSGGHAICATCGHPMIGGRMGVDKTTGKGRRGYVCNTDKRKDRGDCEHPARILAEPLEAHVRGLLVAHVARLDDELEPFVMLSELRAQMAGAQPLSAADVNVSDLGDMIPAVADARDALASAEAKVVKIEALRGTGAMDDDDLEAALASADRKVHKARTDLEVAEVGAEPERELPGAIEIDAAPIGELGEHLERYGLVARVEPGLGDRRPGRVARRVRLESTSTA